jgi:hypothetical protein
MAFKYQNKKNPTILRDAGLALSGDYLRATRPASQVEAARGEAREYFSQESVCARTS